MIAPDEDGVSLRTRVRDIMEHSGSLRHHPKCSFTLGSALAVRHILIRLFRISLQEGRCFTRTDP